MPALVQVSAHQLAAEGKLDEAADRYFTAFRVIQQLAPVNRNNSLLCVGSNFDALLHWAALKNQTPERIRETIHRLEQIDCGLLQIPERFRSNYFVAHRSISAGEALMPFWQTHSHGESVWMLRSSHRSFAAVGKPTGAASAKSFDRKRAARAEFIRLVLAGQFESGPDNGRSLILAVQWPDAFENSTEISEQDRQWLKWTATTIPTFGSVGDFNLTWPIRELVEFEARRRGTMLVMAIQAYRLEHGKLPESLADLKGEYFKELPVDPYSDLEFRYFPDGLPGLLRPPGGDVENSITRGEPH